jgi:Tol biopolymer transport system component
MRWLELDDVYRIPQVSDPQRSPDDGSVAFVVTTADREKDANPRWSPNGRWLAFVAARDGKKARVWLLPVDGGEARAVTSIEAGAGSPVWSPNSSRVAVLSPVGAANADEYKSDGAGLLGDKRMVGH